MVLSGCSSSALHHKHSSAHGRQRKLFSASTCGNRQPAQHLLNLAAVDEKAGVLRAPPVAAVVLDELRVVNEVVFVVVLVVPRRAAGTGRLLGLQLAQ